MSASFELLQEEIDKLGNNHSLDDVLAQSTDFLSYLKEIEMKLTNKDPEVQNGKTLSKSIQAKYDGISKNVLKDEKSINTSIKKYSSVIDNKIFNSNNSMNLDSVYKYQIDLKNNRTKKLIDRAIIIHLLRNGQFEISSILEAEKGMNIPKELLNNFANLNNICDSLLINENLKPAIDWATENSENLRLIGSDLEFNLHKLQFFKLYKNDCSKEINNGEDFNQRSLLNAFRYAKSYFPYFGQTHLDEISKLLYSMIMPGGQINGGDIFSGDNNNSNNVINDRNSNYNILKRKEELNDKTIQSIYNQICQDYCSLMGLMSQSPIFNTLLTSFISLPSYIKYYQIFKISKGKLDWTSNNELPFEVNLPDYLQFHSIFVCPISKEETTPENPPMVLPCHHLISKESVLKLSRNHYSGFKCPYCPKTTMSSQCSEVKFINL